MKPVYCNSVGMTHNLKTGEVTLSFAHIYTEHNLSAAGAGLTDVSARMADEEASVIMNRETFLTLKRLIDKTWEGMNP